VVVVFISCVAIFQGTLNFFPARVNDASEGNKLQAELDVGRSQSPKLESQTSKARAPNEVMRTSMRVLESFSLQASVPVLTITGRPLRGKTADYPRLGPRRSANLRLKCSWPPASKRTNRPMPESRRPCSPGR
jgi:hypothetical protein